MNLKRIIREETSKMKSKTRLLIEGVNNLVVYHGGYTKLNNDGIMDYPMFTTNDIEVAKWYAYRSLDSGDSPWLTKMVITIQNPLTCDSKMDFKNKFIPILDEAGIDYEFKENEYGVGWYFESYDILDNGGYIENNVFDLVYIDKFVEVAKKHGYDGMIGDDPLTNDVIDVFIPFYKRNIKVISSEIIS